MILEENKKFPCAFPFFDENITPERRLIVAVFLRAFLDLYSDDEIVKKRTLRWFKSKEFRIMSFAWCCEAMEIERDEIFERLDAMGVFQANLGKMPLKIKSLIASHICR